MTVLMIASAVIAAGLWQAAENASTSFLNERNEARDRDNPRV